MVIAKSPGATSVGSNPQAGASKASAKSPLASISQTNTRFPRLAAKRARPAATAVLPTPPLPVTKSNRRSTMPVAGRLRSAKASSAGRSPAPVGPPTLNTPPAPASGSDGSPEADPSSLGACVELDIGELGGRDPNLAASPVGEPQHPRRFFDGGLDLGN